MVNHAAERYCRQINTRLKQENRKQLITKLRGYIQKKHGKYSGMFLYLVFY